MCVSLFPGVLENQSIVYFKKLVYLRLPYKRAAYNCFFSNIITLPSEAVSSKLLRKQMNVLNNFQSTYLV